MLARAHRERSLPRRHAREPGRRRARLDARDDARPARARQGRADVPLGHRRRSRPSSGSCRSASCCASSRTTSASACSSPSTARTRAGIGQDPALLDRAKVVVDVDHHHDNTRFGSTNLIVADASSTAEIVRDLLWELGVQLTPEIAEALYVGLVTDTGRFQYSNTTPKSFRLAAELVEAGADVHGIFRSVYETVQFAKLKLLARALDRAQLYEGGRLLVSYLRARRLRRGRRRGAVLRGDHRLPAPGRRRADGGADPRAAERRRARRGASRSARARTRSTCRRSRARRAAAATGRRPDSRARTRSTEIAEFIRREFVASTGGRSCGCRRGRVSRSGSRCSTSRPAHRRSRSSPSCGAAPARRPGTRARSTRSRRGCSCCCPGAATRLAPCFVGLDKRYVTEIDLTATTTTGDPEGEVVERHEAPARTSSRRGSTASAARSSCRSRRLRGEDRRRARLQAGAAGHRGRDAAAALAGLRARRARARRRTRHARPARQLRHVRALDRGGARRPLPDAAADRGRPVRRRGGGRRAPAAGLGGARAAPARGRRARARADPRARARARGGGRADEGRPRARRARAAAARGRDRHLRRRPPRPSLGRAQRRSRPGPLPTVVTFHPHPREVLGNQVSLLATLERRLELLAELGVEETLVVEFTPELAALDAGGVRPTRTSPRSAPSSSSPARSFRFGRARSGDLALLERLGIANARRAARRRRLVDADPPARRGRRRARRGAAARPPGRGRGHGRLGRGARRHARLPDREPPHRPDAARARATASTPAPRSTTARRSRSASTRTTAAPSGRSRCSCSTSRATCTASGSSSSSGSACATRRRSRARARSSPRSRATSRHARRDSPAGVGVRSRRLGPPGRARSRIARDAPDRFDSHGFEPRRRFRDVRLREIRARSSRSRSTGR